MSKSNLYKDRIKAFWHFVDKRMPSECWEWQGNKDKAGYGRIKFKDKYHKAHRLSYEINVGPVPEGLFICHHCDNPPCVNPNHLYAGTPRDNNNDTVARGRNVCGEKHWTRSKPERVLRGEAHGRAKLTSEQVTAIRQAYANGFSQSHLAVQYGVNWSTINRII